MIDPAIIAWATEHWWLAFWLVFWALVFGYTGLVLLVNVVRFAINRPLRTIKVLARGWPPAHLDADGDWKPEPKDPDAPAPMDTIKLLRACRSAMAVANATTDWSLLIADIDRHLPKETR